MTTLPLFPDESRIELHVTFDWKRYLTGEKLAHGAVRYADRVLQWRITSDGEIESFDSLLTIINARLREHLTRPIRNEYCVHAWSTAVAAPIKSNGTRFICCRTSMLCSQWLNPDSRQECAGAWDARTKPFRLFSFQEPGAGICDEISSKRERGKSTDWTDFTDFSVGSVVHGAAVGANFSACFIAPKQDEQCGLNA